MLCGKYHFFYVSLRTHIIYRMDRTINRSDNLLLFIISGILGVSVLLFWGCAYPSHLHFQEQYQLFLFSSDYICDVLSVPGGFADLLGRFLTQFFYYSWAGAAIMALLIVFVHRLTCVRLGGGVCTGLSLVPIILLMLFYMDEHALLGGLVAILLALLAAYAVESIRIKQLQTTIYIALVPVFYWALGPLCLLYVLWSKQRLVPIVVALILLAAMPLLCNPFLAMPLEKLYLSPHYYRYPQLIPWLLWGAVGSMVLFRWTSEWLRTRAFVLSLPTCSLVSAGLAMFLGVGAIWKTYNRSSEEAMCYDFMARSQQWNHIVEKARNQAPRSAISCTALNLALGMKGQLSDHLFEYPQNGLSGLLPPFAMDPVSPLVTSEAFYQLGMINTAQRFVFEAQEAIPDYQKSGRCYRRLAETNLICGNYAVSRKYLNALSRSLFYREWALSTLRLLDDELAIENHKEYGRLRRLMPVGSYLFSDQETPQMLGSQFLANRSNRLAYEYLQASYMLLRDIDSFVQCLSLSSSLGYVRMPVMHQQALLLWWSRDHTAQDQIPQGVNPQLVNSMKQFYTLAQQNPVNQELLESRFGNTYWYYYFYRK